MAEKTADQLELEANGFYKLNWLQRIGYGAGDMAQNFFYQNVSGFINYFYTDVYVIGGDTAKSNGISSALMLVVRLIDVLWDPIVGAFVDKHHPRMGKYRSYLLTAGLPLCLIAILCYWDGPSKWASWINIVYAVITYTLLQMCYTLTNVPYGALNASMTRDSHEIDVLTTTRMAMANIAGLFVWTGFPIVTKILAKEDQTWGVVLFNFIGAIPGIFLMPLVPSIRKLIGKKNVFYVFGVIGCIGYLLLYVIKKFSWETLSITIGGNKESVALLIANFIKSIGLSVCTGYMWAIVPEVITYAEYTTGRRIAGIVNALTGIFFKAGFAIGGALPGLINQICGYDAKLEKQEEGGGSSYTTKASAWFQAMLIYGGVGLLLMVFCFTQSKENVVMDEKETKNVKVSDLWTEFLRNGPLRVIALYFITGFCCMNVHNTSVGYFFKMDTQGTAAKEGILWCISIIPVILFALMILIMYFYSLTDEKMDEINKEIELRAKKEETA
jgi:Na+/melibiose symporter-like transporter